MIHRELRQEAAKDRSQPPVKDLMENGHEVRKALCTQEEQISFSPADKHVFHQHLSRGKWLFRALHKREHTLRRLAKLLIKKHEPYLLGEKRTLDPLTMQEAAKELHLSESTITRAVRDKHLVCPAGTLPLRSFFSQAMKNGKILLKQLIQKENKQKPLSDDALALKLQAQGLPIARRTITKYRKQLRIAPASKRKTLL